MSLTEGVTDDICMNLVDESTKYSFFKGSLSFQETTKVSMRFCYEIRTK